MELKREQKLALKRVLDGHNVCLLGAAGTGKSFVIKEIVKAIESTSMSVAVTATTGIACSMYKNAMTIHRWCGVGDGRFDKSEIRQVVAHNVQYADARQRIMKTDILIIDECSMLSKRFFECLNEVCKIKNSNLPFGGMQLLLAGDFRQLPPVPNSLYGDDGEFCFESRLFEQIMPHRVTLVEVVRQTDCTLIQAIHDVSYGNVTEETSSFIASLQRPLPDENVTDTSVKLFSRNDQVDDYNRTHIANFPGQMYEYISNDEGEQRYLHKILVPRTLWLKVGAPVILMRNLSDKLVNGLQGVVSDINEIGPVIEFASLDVKIPLEKVRFSVFSPIRNKEVAAREQYPLKLAYAITIHKAQGMTLNSLEVDCRGIFKPGQLGVALGRARNSAGLRVINYTPQVCIQQPEVVKNFLDGPSVEFAEDNTCCRSSFTSSGQQVEDTATLTVEELLTIEADIDVDENEDTTEEFDTDFDNIILTISESQHQCVDLPQDLHLETILIGLKCEDVVTTMQYNANKILQEIDRSKYEQFAKIEFSKISLFVEEFKIDSEHTGPVSAQKQSDFYSKVHKYQNSTEFRMNCLSLFEDSQFTEEHLHICFNVSNEIREYILNKKSEQFIISNRAISNRTVSNASHARVRYVGGYCIAKVRHKYIGKKKSSMYKTDEAGQAMFEESSCAVSILDCLKLEEQYIVATTSEPDSLVDVSRRQQKNRALTNISDQLFYFFLKLTEICLKLFVDENLNKYGCHLFEHIRKELMEDTTLKEQFHDVVESNMNVTQDMDEKHVNEEYKEKQIQNIYKKIIKMYLMVMLNQFRKDILESFQIQKKMAHRKQVRVATQGATKSKTTSTKCTELEQPSTSGYQTKKRKPSDKEIASDSTSRTKATKKSKPRPEMSVSESENSESEDVPTSTKQKLKPVPEHISESENSDEGGEKCIVCNTTGNNFKGDVFWIQCDSCNGWFHRTCAGLKHHMKWKKATRKGGKYYCKSCE